MKLNNGCIYLLTTTVSRKQDKLAKYCRLVKKMVADEKRHNHPSLFACS